MKKKIQKKIKIIVLTIMILGVLLGLCFAYFNNKRLNNKEKVINHEKDYSDVTNKLIKMTSSFGKCNNGYYLDFDTNIITEEKLDENFKYNIIYNYLKLENKIIKKYDSLNEELEINENEYEEIIKVSDLENAYQLVFNNDFVKLKSFVIGNNIYRLNNDVYTSSYTITENDSCNNTTNYLLIRSTSNKDIVTFDYIVYYLDKNHFAYKNKNSDSFICKEDEVYDKSSLFARYRYTFVNDGNDNFKFKNAELVKEV